nr:PREDICTED: immunoglobulin superfamily DCC subclass member 3 [Lepisosteus oculatus]
MTQGQHSHADEAMPATPSFFTKMVNATAVQAFWELPSKPGKVEGFKLYHRRVPQPDFQGPHVLPGNTNSFILSQLGQNLLLNDGGETACNCRQESEGSMAGIVVGIHIAMACIIFCVLFLMFGYRRSLFCRKGTQDSWSVPRGADGEGPLAQQSSMHKEGVTCNTEAIELVPQQNRDCSPQVPGGGPSQCQVLIEQHQAGQTGASTGAGTG